MAAEQSSIRVITLFTTLLFFLFNLKFYTQTITHYGQIRCVPSQSTATIKLELLPLTDGIITLDTLQIDVKEKGILLLIAML